MAAIFGAADIVGLSAGVTTLVIGIIGVTLLFVAGRYVQRALARRW